MSARRPPPPPPYSSLVKECWQSGSSVTAAEQDCQSGSFVTAVEVWSWSSVTAAETCSRSSLVAEHCSMLPLVNHGDDDDDIDDVFFD